MKEGFPKGGRGGKGSIQKCEKTWDLGERRGYQSLTGPLQLSNKKGVRKKILFRANPLKFHKGRFQGEFREKSLEGRE